MRVGLVGFGFAGAVFHAPLLTSTSGVELVSIVTSDARRQQRARATYPESRLLDDADELWARADEHDLIVVATPNATHLPLGLRAIELGLAVVMDKPLAVDAAEARRLVSAARAADVLCTVFQNRRWDGDFLTVRALLDQGTLGAVHRFESRFERWQPASTPGAWRERQTPETGGGLLIDLGSHLVDQAVQLFGPPERVYAEVDRRRPGVRADDEVFVALTHPDGTRSHLWTSALAAAPGPRYRVLGAAGAFTKSGMDVQEAALIAGSRPSDDNWGQEAETAWGELTTASETRTVPTERGSYQSFYAGVRDALRHGTPPPVDPEDAVAVLEILEAARRSSIDGSTVPLHPEGPHP